MTDPRILAQAIHRLRIWTEEDYHREGRDWLHLRDLNTVLEAAEQHLKETTP